MAGVVEGTEVVTTALTFSTVVAPLMQLRAKIKFIDSQARAYVPSVDQIMAAITPETRVLFIPNLVGNKPDWAELKRRTAVSPALSFIFLMLFIATRPLPVPPGNGSHSHRGLVRYNDMHT